MKITKQARRDARQLFRSCVVNGVLDEGRTLQAVRAIAQQKPRGYGAVLAQFERLVKLEIARRTARVECAIPLQPAFEAQLRDNLTRIYGNGLNFIFASNPALLGGVRIQVGGDVYDGSVQARLLRLQESF